MTDREETFVGTRARFDVGRLVDPYAGTYDWYDENGPAAVYAFQQWALASALAFARKRGDDSQRFREALGMRYGASHTTLSLSDPERSLRDWCRTLLRSARGGVLTAWAHEEGIAPGSPRFYPLAFRRYRRRDGRFYGVSPAAITGLRNLTGRRIIGSPNPSHKEARTVSTVNLCVTERGWAINLHFGYTHREHTSWVLPSPERAGERGCSGPTLASRPGECLGDFLDRAPGELEARVEPAVEVPWHVYEVEPFVREADPPGYILAPSHSAATSFWYASGQEGSVRTEPSLRNVAFLPEEDRDSRRALAAFGRFAEDRDHTRNIAELLVTMAGPPPRTRSETRAGGRPEAR